MTPAPSDPTAPVPDAPSTDPWRRLRHDLRTSLHQIIGYSEMLLDTLGKGAAGPFHDDLQRLHGAGTGLLSRVGSTFAPGRPSLSEADLAALRTDFLDALRSLVAQRDLCLETARTFSLTEVIPDLEKIGVAATTFRKLLERDLRAEGEAGPSPSDWSSHGTPRNGLTSVTGHLLMVDDDPANRDLLGRRLESLGYTVVGAANGLEALERLAGGGFDLVLLDILMPELDGFQTLDRIKADAVLQHLPVVMLTSLDDVASTVRCIEAGADDYVPKPFNPVLLQARLGAALVKKRLRDRERAHLAELQAERAKSESLLQSILPRAVCDRLRKGDFAIVDAVQEATVLFADIVGFTRIASTLAPGRTVALLSEVFSDFDHLAERLGVEKIKTIGDAFMAVSGVPVPQSNHAALCAEMALQMLDIIDNFNRRNDLRWSVRIGIHTGPVVAGIIGFRKFAYDLWGDTVNIANRLESLGETGIPQVSASTAERIASRYLLEQRGLIELKNRGEIMAYRLLGRAAG